MPEVPTMKNSRKFKLERKKKIMLRVGSERQLLPSESILVSV